MGIDASIALQAKQPQFENPLTQFANVAQIQNAQNQNQLAQYTIGKAQREDADTQAVRNLLTGAGGDMAAGKNALIRGGYYKQAMELGKSQQESDKATSEISKNNATAAKTNQESATARSTAIGATLGSLSQIKGGATAQHVTSAMQHLVDIGQIAPEMAQKIIAGAPTDPAKMQGWLLQGQSAVMGAKDQLAQTTPDANARLSAATTQRGQNMTAGTAAAGRAQSASQHSATLAQGGKPPSGYRWNPDGTMEPIQGGPGAARAAEVDYKREERDNTRSAKRDAVGASIAVIDKALAHPGRTTATGLSGSIDPRNYVPGTSATDFRVVLDQIGGTAFLQAFESLKGGGQITEIEGKKATDAIARLSRAQSDTEFVTSLNDLRFVMKQGQDRLSGKNSPAPKAPNIDTLLDKYK